MPELPDVTVYVEHLARRLDGAILLETRVLGPNLLRTAAPPLRETEGKQVLGVRRIGKRIVLALEDDLFLVFHLMIAGRLHWQEGAPKSYGKRSSAVLRFSTGVLTLTEAGARKRASLHVIRGEQGLRDLDPGGIDPLAASPEDFAAALRRENHTLKRALTDPRILSGIGNSYSDEILHRARLSPLLLTGRLSDADMETLRAAVRETLATWTERLRQEAGSGFPEGVTAFREGMAVHGRYRKPCPVCGTPVQRIVYAENETNYCPRCQTEGRLLADRSLSRLLKADWPRTVEELERGPRG